MTALRKIETAPQRTVLAVPSMHCAGCMSKIERGLAACPGVISARVNLSARTVTVEHDSSLDAHDLVHALSALGYEAQARRLSRFEPWGHTAGRYPLQPEMPHPDFPLTLDLRRPPGA